MKKVCVLTSVHYLFDTRIFHREIKSLQRASFQVTLIAPHDQSEQVEGVEIIGVKKRGKLGRIWNWFRIFQLATKEKADLYHFHDPDLMIVGLLLKLFTKKPVIYDIHEYYSGQILTKEWIPSILRKITSFFVRLLEYVFCPTYSALITATEGVYNNYKKLNKKVFVINNYPDRKFFNKISKEKPARDFLSCIYCGDKTRIRGIKNILKAFLLLKKRGVKVKLEMIGPASPKSFGKEVKNFIKKNNLENTVQDTPRIPFKKAWSQIPKADVGIMPFLPCPNHLIAMPTKILEYMASKLAVVTSDLPLVKKFIEKEKCGLVFRSTSYKDLANKISRLASDRELVKRMAENGEKAFLEKYNWQKEEKKLLKIYKELEG